MMEAGSTTEMSDNFYDTTRRSIPDDYDARHRGYYSRHWAPVSLYTFLALAVDGVV
jgi:hypothetical protein